MTITLPKDPKNLKGFRFPPAVPFEMNSVSLETIWPQLFRLVILEGRDSSRGSNEQADIEWSVRTLGSQKSLIGFDGDSGNRLLNGIVRTSWIRSVKHQKTKKPQIDGLIPYSIASFKAGFPTNQTGFRQLDRFLYELFLENCSGNPVLLRNRLIEIFGQGVEVTGYPSPAAKRRPGSQPGLDVMSEISIRYADGFDTIVPKRIAQPYKLSRALPLVQMGIGRDLMLFIETYHARLPIPLLIEQITTMVGFELLILSLKIFSAMPELIAHPSEMPAALSSLSPKSGPEIFVDFTSDVRELARTMAAACVQRDHLQIDPFVKAMLRLRYTEIVVEQISQVGPAPDMQDFIERPTSTGEHLQMLAQLPVDPQFSYPFAMAVAPDITKFRSVNRSADDSDNEQDEAEIDKLLASFKANRLSAIDQITELLAIPQQKKIRDNIGGWLRSVGGVGKPWGLISGQNDRRSWCYAPGNDLLMVLVQLCAIDRPDWEENPRPQKFGLKHFLEWLETRFGILVDRPPADLGFDSPEHMAAARENLQAMLRRLRQMGIFEDRSDDFSVQKLTPPFMDAVA